MSPGKTSKKPAIQDPFGLLPDEVIHHILSFLPAQQVVRTCVLAQLWRCLWEGATGLRITAPNAPELPVAPDDLATSGELREFVDHLLLLRGHTPLDTCLLMFNVPEDADADVPHVNLWIRHVIRCQVRRLQLSISREDKAEGLHFYVDNLPLVSRHLTRLELTDTGLNDSFLDLSGCPLLEDLEIYNGCFVCVKRILSNSVKRLTIECSIFSDNIRTRIDVPSIVSLRVKDPSWGKTPTLGSMPLLVEAFVRFGLGAESMDHCDNSDSGDCNDDQCEGCYALEGDQSNDSTNNDTNRNRSVLLQGLSEAKSLVLIDDIETYIFKRDMKWCLTFRKLKYLSLNDTNLYSRAFASSREAHSLYSFQGTYFMYGQLLIYYIIAKDIGPEHKVEIKGGHTPVQGSTVISENLRIVEVKCEVVDERVLKVLSLLNTLNIDFNYEEEEEV
ncbi:hypothetical protein U9M48_004537, partial [Paspalum notatum var. saurae]